MANSSYSRLTGLLTSKHSLAVAGQQLDLLTRLIQFDSASAEKYIDDMPEFLIGLDNLFSLVKIVSDQVELIYQCASIWHQLPDRVCANDLSCPESFSGH